MATKLVYITAPSKAEATEIARSLVKERLVACANVIPGVTSFYWWANKLEEDNECIVIGKTVEERADSVIARVKELHSADCPCVVFIPMDSGNPGFLQWIEKETSQ